MAIAAQEVDDAAGVDVISALRATGILAIVRGVPEHLLLDTARALADGGVTALEVTVDTPGAFDAVATWRGAFGPSITVGVGTVTDRSLAERAVAAGAQFLVSPNTDDEVLGVALDAGVSAIAGALTPTEIIRAHRAGAAAVKVFPVSAVGGARYIASLRSPLGDVPLVSVGGVHPDDVVDHIRAGALAAGLGLSLVDRELVQARRFGELEQRARDVIVAVRDAVV